MTVRQLLGSDGGSSSVLAAGGLVTITVLAVALVGSHSALAVRSRTAGAADASALAAADALSGAVVGAACDRAAATAEANGVSLSACVVAGAEVTVEVSTTFGPLDVGARATAGPPPATAPSRGGGP